VILKENLKVRKTYCQLIFLELNDDLETEKQTRKEREKEIL